MNVNETHSKGCTVKKNVRMNKGMTVCREKPLSVSVHVKNSSKYCFEKVVDN